MKQGLKITGDISRRIGSVTPLINGGSATIDIPRDSVYKSLSCQLTGNVVTTFASGTPLPDNEVGASGMSGLVRDIEVSSNGTINIKQVTPYMIHIQNLMASGNFETRGYEAGASAVAANAITTSGGWEFGTTTQITSGVENLLISFENVMAGKGKMNTVYDTRGLASSQIRFNFRPFSDLTAFGNTAPVVYSNNNFEIVIRSQETQALPLDIKLSIWKQTYKNVNFTAQVNDYAVDIERGSFLQGIQFQTFSGASGTATGGAGKNLTNVLLTDIKFVINGTNYVKSANFLALQDQNKSRYGINADFVSNASVLQGSAYLDFLTPVDNSKFGALGTAQDLRQPYVDESKLLLSTDANAVYTSTATVRIMTNIIMKAE